MSDLVPPSVHWRHAVFCNMAFIAPTAKCNTCSLEESDRYFPSSVVSLKIHPRSIIINNVQVYQCTETIPLFRCDSNLLATLYRAPGKGL